MVANNDGNGLLAEHPALQRKLDAFCHDYNLADRAGLIWQCEPADAIALDLENAALRDGLRAGGGESHSYWNAFSSSTAASLVFDGLASSRNSESNGWVTEIHEDGHLLTGLWRFADAPNGSSSNPHLVTWHADGFEEFGNLALKLLYVANYHGRCKLTCTLFNANSLALYFDEPSNSRPARPIARRHLQWPVVTVDTPGGIRAAQQHAARRFRRLFVAA